MSLEEILRQLFTIFLKVSLLSTIVAEDFFFSMIFVLPKDRNVFFVYPVNVFIFYISSAQLLTYWQMN